MADRNGRRAHGYAYDNYNYDNYDGSAGYAASAYAAADAAAARNSGRTSYTGEPRRAGSLPGSRYPNPSTAYGSYSYPAPGTGRRSFGREERQQEELGEEERGGRRRFSSDGRLSPPAFKAPSGEVSPREADVREADARAAMVAAKRARVAYSNGSSYSYSAAGADRGDLPGSPRDAERVPVGTPSRGPQSRPAQGMDARYRGAQDADARYRESGNGRAWSYSDQHAPQQHRQYDSRPWRGSSSPHEQYARPSSAGASSRSGNDSPLAGHRRRASWGARDAAQGASSYAPGPSSAKTSRSAAAAAVAAAAVVDPNSLAWPIVEAEGELKLDEAAQARREETDKAEAEGKSPFRICPLRGCTSEISQHRGTAWMQQHLRVHTKGAAEKHQTADYIRSSVAELLHEMCLDSEFFLPSPPLAPCLRALLGTPRTGMDFSAAVVETKVTEDNDDPSVRRCAYDLAEGGCDGLDAPGTIVRCDKCLGSFHVSCGKVGLGKAVFHTDARNGALCRTCSRQMYRTQNKEPYASVLKQMALARGKRKSMLEFLEKEAEGGGKLHGVFDLNVTTAGDASEQNALSPGGKGGVTPQIDGGGTSSSVAEGDAEGATEGEVRPPCAAERCERRSRPDSRFCSDSCGVIDAEKLLAEALRHSLEERGGNERGRRILELREMKNRKQEILQAMKKVQQPRAPSFSTAREKVLQGMVARRCRLWKRLVEIGAYWEKVSGSSNLLAAANAAAAKVSPRQAAAAIASGGTKAGEGQTGQSRGGLGGGGGGGGGVVGSGSGSGNGTQTVRLAPAAASAASAVAAAPQGKHGAGDEGVEMAEAGGKGAGGGCLELQHRNADCEGRGGGGGGENSGSADRKRKRGGETEATAEATGAAHSEKGTVASVVSHQPAPSGQTRPLPGGGGAAPALPPTAGPPPPPPPPPLPLPPRGAVRLASSNAPSPGDGQSEMEMDVDVGEESPTAAATTAYGGTLTPAAATGATGAAAGPAAAGVTAAVTAGAGAARADLAPSYTTRAPGVTATSKDGGDARPCPEAAEHGPGHRNRGGGGCGDGNGSREPEGHGPTKRLKGDDGGLGAQEGEKLPQQPQQQRQQQQSQRQPQRQPKQRQPGTIPRDGLEDLVCVYCGKATGANVTEHLEQCYKKIMALRNERLDAATLRPTPEERRKLLLEEASSSHGRGGGEAASDATAIAVPSSASVAVAAAAAAGVTTTNPSHSWTAIGRKLLTRRVAYASFDKLPNPGQFQLHPDLKGWKDSPSRLDFLYKELVRQRNAAIYELQALDRDEADLEFQLRRDWMKDDLRSVPR